MGRQYLKKPSRKRKCLNWPCPLWRDAWSGPFPWGPFQKPKVVLGGACYKLMAWAEGGDGMVCLKLAFLEQEPAVSLLLHLVKLVPMIGVDTRDSSGSLTLLCNSQPLQAQSLGSGDGGKGVWMKCFLLGSDLIQTPICILEMFPSWLEAVGGECLNLPRTGCAVSRPDTMALSESEKLLFLRFHGICALVQKNTSTFIFKSSI